LDYNRQISRRLHEEHMATLALWGRVEQAVLAASADRALLERARAALRDELNRHFAFEERDLFPRLAAAGESDIAELLQEEHDAIRASAERFSSLVGNPSDPQFRAIALALVEQLVAHVQKEEMALLPMLEDLIDEHVDFELSTAYAGA
jgi:DUF438 domain-containing protein